MFNKFLNIPVLMHNKAFLLPNKSTFRMLGHSVTRLRLLHLMEDFLSHDFKHIIKLNLHL